MNGLNNKNEKNYLKNIYYHLKGLNFDDSMEMNYIFSFLGIILLATGFFKGDSLNDYLDFSFLILGQIILFILIVYNFLRVNPAINKFIELRLTKFFVIFYLTSYLFYSRSQVEIELNNIFEVPGNTFGYSLYFGSIIYFINHFLSYYIYLLYFILFAFFSNRFDFFLNQRHKFTRLQLIFNSENYYFVIAIFLTVVTFSMKENDVSRNALPYKLYIIAKNLDFDVKSKCDQIDSDQSVVYLNANKDRILINNNYSFGDEEIISIYNFMRDKNKDYKEFNNLMNSGGLIFAERSCYINRVP
ncbi:hypothetical protein [Acinetobacter guillouiae]|uniref:Uncharacterized protein n=1 Tax=Acinetobacter guillouiae NIPH 991 TaxID=1217656 RepID=N8Y898_ACIGI|nr:hypothetical protein [Acinetobacter guillouiae]ENV15878.1 hypothetical protein F964_02812 [Acinetobacter guillouiae NIPH 991]